MNTPPSSPIQEAAAEAVSSVLYDAIKAEIGAGEGFLDFRRFMELALYAPGLGYYVAGTRKFGHGGDFVTAPEISSLFSSCLAMQCVEILARSGGDTILEFGAGSGVMASDLLAELDRLKQLPEAYLILELSPELRDRQRETIGKRVPKLLGRVQWLDGLDDIQFSGAVMANEVLDAMPVEAFEKDGEGLWQRGVSTDESGGLIWSRKAMPEQQLEVLESLEQLYGADWHLPYRSEWNPQLQGWFQALYNSIETGALILLDYGYPGADYYHAQRSEGTLIAHFQHRAHDNLLTHVGLQDLTANVDFTAVADAATAAGFGYAGYTTQAFFLMANGLDQFFQRAKERVNEVERVKLSQQVRQLTLPAEMGERFQVIGFAKSMPGDLQGFRLHDLSHRL